MWASSALSNELTSQLTQHRLPVSSIDKIYLRCVVTLCDSRAFFKNPYVQLFDHEFKLECACGKPVLFFR